MWHFRPSGDELLDAIEDFLCSLKKNNWDDAKFYESRIAANCAAIVQREQAAVIGQDAALNKKLADFMEIEGTSKQLIEKLSLRIRHDVYELDNPDLQELLKFLATERLKVDNPRYPGLREVLSQP